ncbi:MAG: hypothetical protein RL078_739 [Bacteroidota bacterium]|jgi:hypothetical protein
MQRNKIILLLFGGVYVRVEFGPKDFEIQAFKEFQDKEKQLLFFQCVLDYLNAEWIDLKSC